MDRILCRGTRSAGCDGSILLYLVRLHMRSSWTTIATQRRQAAVLLSTIELLRERFLTRILSALHEKGLSLDV